MSKIIKRLLIIGLMVSGAHMNNASAGTGDSGIVGEGCSFASSESELLGLLQVQDMISTELDRMYLRLVQSNDQGEQNFIRTERAKAVAEYLKCDGLINSYLNQQL